MPIYVEVKIDLFLLPTHLAPLYDPCDLALYVIYPSLQLQPRSFLASADNLSLLRVYAGHAACIMFWLLSVEVAVALVLDLFYILSYLPIDFQICE